MCEKCDEAADFFNDMTDLARRRNLSVGQMITVAAMIYLGAERTHHDDMDAETFCSHFFATVEITRNYFEFGGDNVDNTNRH